jgi:hypothetical protein
VVSSCSSSTSIVAATTRPATGNQVRRRTRLFDGGVVAGEAEPDHAGAPEQEADDRCRGNDASPPLVAGHGAPIQRFGGRSQARAA